MSTNSTASPGGDTPTPCCKATTLLAAAATSFLFCFVLVVAFLFLRFLLQRQRWRRRAWLLHHQQQPPPPKLGLDAAAIALIPSFPYRGADGAACPTSLAGPAECAVCLGVLEEGQMARELTGCKHVFHRECIDVWLASRASCPVCRGKAEPAQSPRERAAAAATARVVAIEMFDDQVQSSLSSTAGGDDETTSWSWTRPSEAAGALA